MEESKFITIDTKHAYKQTLKWVKVQEENVFFHRE